MTELIQEPVIVVCDEVLVFESLSHATVFIEPWDTEDCSAAYDSEGRLLRVFESSKLEERPRKAKQQAPPWLPPVIRPTVQWCLDQLHGYAQRQLADFKVTKIEPLERVPTHQDELRAVLVEWLNSLYTELHERKKLDTPVSKEELSRESLAQLVIRAAEYSVE